MSKIFAQIKQHLKHKGEVALLGATVVLLVLFILFISKSVGFLVTKVDMSVGSEGLLTIPETVTFNLEKLDELGLEVEAAGE